jgi:hypothetical protein
MRRSELYALVWSEPLRHLAPRFGLSDSGLGKICTRHDIPIPYRGYWAKRLAGAAAKQTPLPDPLRDEAVERLKMFDASGIRLNPEGLADEWIIPGVLKRVFPPAPAPKVLSIKLPIYPPLPSASPVWNKTMSALARTPKPTPIPSLTRETEENLGGAIKVATEARPPRTELPEPPAPVRSEPSSLLPAASETEQPRRQLPDKAAYLRVQLERVFATAAERQQHKEAMDVLAELALSVAGEETEATRHVLRWIVDVRQALLLDDPIKRLGKSLRTDSARPANSPGAP